MPKPLQNKPTQRELAEKARAAKQRANEREQPRPWRANRYESLPSVSLSPNPAIDLIRKHELAKRLGINRWTLMRWCKERKFPQPIRLSDVVIAWRVSDVEAWLQQRATDAA